MKKLIDSIVSYPKRMIVVYSILLVASLIGMGNVQVEYDLSAYLPEEMSSYQGKELLEKEFEMGGMASLMVQETNEEQMITLVEQVKTIEGIKEVVYLPGNGKEGYSNIGLVFKKGSSTLETQAAITAIEELMGEYTYYIGGESAIAKDMQEITKQEIVIYGLLAFLVITIILLLASQTYHEPFYFFIVIGVAIALNMGTNSLFAKISSNTNAVASILQLAVSMDYSIFLMHRYNEEKLNLTPKEAMAKALRRTFGSVSASALTTIGGFLALVGMQYGIGRDMGLVLAKGVVCSLIGVMTLLPALVLTFDHKFTYKPHRVWIPSLKGLSTLFIRLRYVALVVAVVIAIPTFLMHTKVDYYYSNEKTLKDSAQSIESTKAINEVFGMANQIVVLTPKENGAKLAETMEKVQEVDGIQSAFGLYSIVSEKLPLEFIPKEMVDKFQTDDYTYFAVVLDRPMEGESTSQTLEKLNVILKEQLGDDYFVTGESVIYDDLQKVTAKDFKVVTALSIFIVGLVLAITFKSVTIPLILLFIIQLGIWINLSIPYVTGQELNFISFIILGAIQLGATVDYAILFTESYREQLLQHKPVIAMKKTIADTSRAVLTSALILIAGTLSVYMITTIRSAAELTLLIARGAMISVVLVYVLLPAMLLIGDKVIAYTTLNWPTFKKK